MMSKDEPREQLTATHHAMLFAWISRAVIQRIGEEKGEMVVRKAVRRYGEQRGRRMALRSQANRHALTMTNYMAYGEWEAGKGEMEQKIVEKVPHAKVLVYRCPWHKAWEKNGLIQYGRFYCLEVDEALVRGFNPELRLDVNSTQANAGTHCEFVFHSANLTVMNLLSLAYKKSIRPGKKALMPWGYHIGHLYKTMGEVVIEELGQTGREAVSAALAEFAQHYGEEAAQIVVSYRDTDFNNLPE